MEINRIIQGDCMKVMKYIQDKSIDMVLTSPPYDNIRNYNDTLDWGKHVWEPVIQELFRIVKDGGVVVWVVGDATIKRSETGTSFKQSLWAMECGFNLHDTMIYEKDTCPFPEINRYYQYFEYMFVWSKGIPKTCNQIIDKPNRNAGKKITGTQRKTDGSTIPIKNENGKRIKDFGVRGNVWKYQIGKWKVTLDAEAYEHPAIFPEKLAYDHIISWSNEGEIILDPFAGSGTVGKIAKQLNRRYILIEKEPKYINIIRKRLNVNL